MSDVELSKLLAFDVYQYNLADVAWNLFGKTAQEIPQPSITEIICNIKYLKFHSNFPEANELIMKIFAIELEDNWIGVA